MTTTPDLALAAEFPPADREQWLALVDKVLKGADFDRKLVSTTYDGIRIEPLYTRADRSDEVDAYPGQPDRRRGTRAEAPANGAWDIRASVVHPEPAEANRRALEDLEGGASSLELRLDVGGAGDVDGVVVGGSADLAAALDGVYLDLIAVVVNGGASGSAAADLVIERWDAAAVSGDQRRGNLGLDPLGALAASGRLPNGWDAAATEFVGMARRTAEWPNVRALHVDTAPYVDAGASEVEELALMLATGIAYLDALTSGGLDLDTACAQIGVTVAADADVFMTIAKIRAARRLWSHAVTAAGGADPVVPIAVRSARRMITTRDPWVNMLRVTAAGFAAGAAGADAVTLDPYDAAIGESDELARRVARNTQLILQEESHIGFVVDPAGGSYYVETLTDQLTAAAWRRFQELQAAGGLLDALQSGAVAERLAEIRSARMANIARRKDPITGVSEFPNLAEPVIEREPVDVTALRAAAAAAWGGPALGDGSDAVRIDPLPVVALASEFEELRDASDRQLSATGARPSVFLANLDTVAVHTARATFAKNFFEAGGIEAIGNDGFESDDAVVEAFAASGSPAAIICSSDAVYADRAAVVATALKAAGARRVYLAGNPGDRRDEFTAAGVDEFIFVGVDALAVLRSAHDLEGVAR